MESGTLARVRTHVNDNFLKPLPQVAIDAMHRAVAERARNETFLVYDPEYGYERLSVACRKGDLKRCGARTRHGQLGVLR